MKEKLKTHTHTHTSSGLYDGAAVMAAPHNDSGDSSDDGDNKEGTTVYIYTIE